MTTLEQSKPADEARDSVLRSGAVSSCNDLLARPVLDALALVNFGTEKTSDWLNVAGPMCAHCIGTENVDQAAGRILAAEIERLRAFARNIRDNFDCDEDAHKHGTMCRACSARDLLPKPKDKD